MRFTRALEFIAYKPGWAILVLLVAGCAHAPVEKVVMPEPEVVTFNIESLKQTLSTARFVLPWELRNPGWEPAKVESIAWTLRIDGESEQKGENSESTLAEANNRAPGTLVVLAQLAKTKDAFSARESKASLEYTIEALFKVSNSSGTFEYVTSWRGEIFPPKWPKVFVEPFMSRYGSAGEAEFHIFISNPNPFDVRVQSFNFILKLMDFEIAKGVLTSDWNLLAGAETQFDVSRQIDRRSFPILAAKLPTRRSVPYTAQLTLAIEDLVVDNLMSGEIHFPR